MAENSGHSNSRESPKDMFEPQSPALLISTKDSDANEAHDGGDAGTANFDTAGSASANLVRGVSLRLSPPELIRESVLNYEPPPGWVKSPIPSKHASVSNVYQLGVKVESIPKSSDDPKLVKFMCLASDKCRHNQVGVKLQKGTSSAWDHLRAVHPELVDADRKRRSKRQLDAKAHENVASDHIADSNAKVKAVASTSHQVKRKAKPKSAPSEVGPQSLVKEWVRAATVRRGLGFRMMSDVDLQSLFTRLHSEEMVRILAKETELKKCVCEMYLSCYNQTKERCFALTSRSSAVYSPIVSISATFARSSGCLVLHSVFIDDLWNPVSELLCIQRLEPHLNNTKEDESTVLSRLVKEAVATFLPQQDVFCLLSNVHEMLPQPLPSEKPSISRECALPHLVARCMEKVFETLACGSAHDKSSSRVLVQIGSVVWSVLGYDPTKSMLTEPHDWCAFIEALGELTGVKETVLRCSGIGQYKEVLLEMYSILSPFLGIFRASPSEDLELSLQTTTYFTLIELRTSVLSEEKPLNIVALGKESDVQQPRARSALTWPAALFSRLLRDEVDKSCLPLYPSDAGTTHTRGAISKIDMAHALNPGTRTLDWINTISQAKSGGSEATVPAGPDQYKEKIWSEITDLTARFASPPSAVEHKDPKSAETHSEMNGKVASPAKKRTRGAPTRGARSAAAPIDSGASDYSALAMETARKEVEQFRNDTVPDEYSDCATNASAWLAYWKEYGAEQFPTLARVARALLSVALCNTSSSELCWWNTSTSSSSCDLGGGNLAVIDPGYDEMLMHLRYLYHRIPSEGNDGENSTQEIRAQLPERISQLIDI
eukprot:CAMPEP_0182450536 /NCGR_PEP_ID=MMETSP1172-20130603/41907_1 /TAXON_ID=708627 /ORGANISM="Timspurckia oligopyrenoides, Strain CCMP3278" /LENGTH=831 /DNA_ID=CAMNT_0024648169 /DNA_START=71 /DNA_END=2566 /DNA_ORIENTATION=-